MNKGRAASRGAVSRIRPNWERERMRRREGLRAKGGGIGWGRGGRGGGRGGGCGRTGS